MDVREVVFRDEGEENFPRYRVCFWSRPGRIPEENPVKDVGFDATEYEISDARSVYDVLAWAEAHSGPERTFCVYLLPETRRHAGEWMYRLAGVNPTSAETYGQRPGGYSWDSTDALGGPDQPNED
jgi:hypothetical protein